MNVHELRAIKQQKKQSTVTAVFKSILNADETSLERQKRKAMYYKNVSFLKVKILPSEITKVNY